MNTTRSSSYTGGVGVGAAIEQLSFSYNFNQESFQTNGETSVTSIRGESMRCKFSNCTRTQKSWTDYRGSSSESGLTENIEFTSSPRFEFGKASAKINDPVEPTLALSIAASAKVTVKLRARRSASGLYILYVPVQVSEWVWGWDEGFRSFKMISKGEIPCNQITLGGKAATVIEGQCYVADPP